MKTRYCAITLILVAAMITSCETSPESRMKSLTIDQLVVILKQEPDGANFLFAVQELGRRKELAAEAAPALARALAYSRHDSTEAAIALMGIGPDAIDAAPELVTSLQHERPEVRAYAALALGSIGAPAECAVPDLAQLLSDDEATVRTAGAIALAETTNYPLVDAWLIHRQPEDSRNIILDDPKGSISGKALSWWIGEGQMLQWSGEPNACFVAKTE